MSENKGIIPAVADGEVFRLAGMEFIKFPEVDGKTPVLMKDIAFESEFGDNNDLRKSRVLVQMEKVILPKIIEAVGEENVCEFATDLTTLDGLKNYGVMKSRISLPTLDFYRANAEILGRYKPDAWWWLATPESCQPNEKPWWTLCVSPAGFLPRVRCNYGLGVRPFCILKSSIFGA